MDQGGEREMILILADISGYTRYMLSNRTAVTHAQAILTTLLQAVIREVEIPLEVSKLEGDAIFMFADAGRSDDWTATCRAVGAKLGRFIEAFDRTLQALVQVNSCPCPPCRHAGDLRLKVLAHAGRALRYRLGPFEELAGVDVILLHRLLKNDLRARSYILLTASAWATLQPGAEPDWTARVLDYGELGQFPVRVHTPPAHPPLPPLRPAWLWSLRDHLRKLAWRFRPPVLPGARLTALPEGAADPSLPE